MEKFHSPKQGHDEFQCVQHEAEKPMGSACRGIPLRSILIPLRRLAGSGLSGRSVNIYVIPAWPRLLETILKTRIYFSTRSLFLLTSLVALITATFFADLRATRFAWKRYGVLITQEPLSRTTIHERFGIPSETKGQDSNLVDWYYYDGAVGRSAIYVEYDKLAMFKRSRNRYQLRPMRLAIAIIAATVLTGLLRQQVQNHRDNK